MIICSITLSKIWSQGLVPKPEGEGVKEPSQSVAADF